MNEREYYSDKVTETDEKLTKKEIEDHVQPKAKKSSDSHVLHVYDESWDHTVRELLRLSDKVENAPEWTISQLYHSDHTDDDNKTDSKYQQLEVNKSIFHY
ncbi:8829_t:CDS:2 [Funneliformis geosporum]|uniref:8829_t:CDS:1 n=1 Tax=Funneliformis geosporum TaxID=1117311 RepID=A0A9W4SVA5_9GLOM|nr:8829_t:CDS:2 [Funneliformis geosporum]